MFKTTSAKTPQEYIDLIDEPRKSEIKKLHEFIQECVPKLKPHIQSGMIGYGSYHYKYASGREGEWFVVGLASCKDYVSVYLQAYDYGSNGQEIDLGLSIDKKMDYLYNLI